MPVKKIKPGPHPIYGMEGTKPRLDSEPEPDDPKAPARARAAFSQHRKYDLAYKKFRVEQMRLKLLRETLKLALERDELVRRSVVDQQLGFLLAAVRSRMLAIPPNIGARLGKAAAEIARAKVYEALREMAEFPVTLTRAQWEEYLAKEEEGKEEGSP